MPILLSLPMLVLFGPHICICTKYMEVGEDGSKTSRKCVFFLGPKHQQYPSPKWKMLNITHRGLRWFNYLNLLFSAVYMMFKGDVHRKPWTCERDLNKMNVYFRLLAESATSPDPISRFTAKCSGTQMEEPLMNFLLFDFTTCLL